MTLLVLVTHLSLVVSVFLLKVLGLGWVEVSYDLANVNVMSFD